MATLKKIYEYNCPKCNKIWRSIFYKKICYTCRKIEEIKMKGGDKNERKDYKRFSICP